MSEHKCPFCKGTGEDEHKNCDVCGGTGSVPQDVVYTYDQARLASAQRRLSRLRKNMAGLVECDPNGGILVYVLPIPDFFGGKVRWVVQHPHHPDSWAIVGKTLDYRIVKRLATEVSPGWIISFDPQPEYPVRFDEDNDGPVFHFEVVDEHGDGTEQYIEIVCPCPLPNRWKPVLHEGLWYWQYIGLYL